MSTIQTALAKYPRVELNQRPTPLQKLEHLSAALNVNFYLKRDDLTELTFGGDKARKLEYELAGAKEQGYDTLVTVGSSQSNNARLTTAAARKLGMDSVVVLNKDEWEAFQGNLLTVFLMGARVELIPVDDHWALESYAKDIIADLEAQGRKPYYVPVSATTPRACLGYVRCALEYLEQLKAYCSQLDAVYTPFGTGGIFAATLLTLREVGIDCPVIGISVNRRKSQCLDNLEIRWSALCELLDIDPNRARGDYEIYDDFLGEAYGVATEAGLDAIMMVGKYEGILLDPVYSGKVFSGFYAHHQAGRWQNNEHILMIHSGGTPALFAYHEVFKQYLGNKGVLPESLL